MHPTARQARNQFDRDVAWSAFAMLVPIAIGLLALPVIFRNAGEQVFTLFLLSYGAINFAPSLDLGVARTAQRRVAYAAALHPDAQRAVVEHSLRRVMLVAIGAMLLVMVGAVLLFPLQHGQRPLGLAIVTGMGVAVAIYANTQRGVLEGLGAFSRSALNRAGVGVMLVGAPVVVSFFLRDATFLSLASLAIRFPFAWEQHRAIRNALHRRTAPGDAAHEDLVAHFMRESGWFALLSILAVAMSGFDRYLMIGWGGLAGQQLAIFLATQDLALRAVAVPAALLPALTVRLAAGNAGEAARQMARRLFLAIVPLTVVGCMGAALLAPWIAHLLYPQLPLGETTLTIRILLIGIVANVVAQFPSTRLIATGRARDAALMHSGEFLLYLAVMPLVVGALGAPGAAALWAGRVVLDTLLLIGWSAHVQRNRAAMTLEGVAVLLGAGVIATVGLIA